MANRFTYLDDDNSATDSQNLVSRDEPSGAASGRDVYVKQVLFGDPDDGDRFILHDAVTQPGHASGMDSIAVGECAFKLTQPSAGAGLDLVREVTFAGKGLRLNGGSFHTDCEEVTVIWEPVAEADG